MKSLSLVGPVTVPAEIPADTVIRPTTLVDAVIRPTTLADTVIRPTKPADAVIRPTNPVHQSRRRAVATRLPSTSSGPEHVEGNSPQAVPARKIGGYGDPPYKPGASISAKGGHDSAAFDNSGPEHVEGSSSQAVPAGKPANAMIRPTKPADTVIRPT